MPFAPINYALRRAFILCVICLAVFQFSENSVDVDLWGHVVFGQEYLTTGKLATTEPYSWTAAGQPWTNHEILAEVVLALAHRSLGGAGLLLLKILVGLAAWLTAIRIAGQRSAVTWAFAALAVVEISYGFAARPQIFTALALTVEFWILQQFHEGRWRWAFALPLIFVIWINTHGGALAGIVLLLVAVAATTTQTFLSQEIFRRFCIAPPESFPPYRQTVRLWIAFVASSAALLCNPYGYELIRWLVESVLWLRPEIAEWNPVKFSADHAAFFLCVAVAAAGFLFTRRSIALWELACAGALGFMAIRSARHTPLFCLAALAFAPPHLADALNRFQNSFARLSRLFRRAEVQRFCVGLLVLVSAGIVVAMFTLHKTRAWTMEVNCKQYPVAALDFIKRNELHGNLLVFFDWGEQCIWELPGSKVSIDGRLDTCYPRDVINAHWKFYNDAPYEQNALDLSKADYALLPANMAGAVSLWRQGGWFAVYADELAVVLVKEKKRFHKLASLADTVKGANTPMERVPFPDAPSTRFPAVH